MNEHAAMVHAVTEYDRKQSAKSSYSIYDMAERKIEIRPAIFGHFTGRLLDVYGGLTRKEIIFGGARPLTGIGPFIGLVGQQEKPTRSDCIRGRAPEKTRSETFKL